MLKIIEVHGMTKGQECKLRMNKDAVLCAFSIHPELPLYEECNSVLGDKPQYEVFIKPTEVTLSMATTADLSPDLVKLGWIS
jgi:hypothetical protein